MMKILRHVFASCSLVLMIGAAGCGGGSDGDTSGEPGCRCDAAVAEADRAAVESAATALYGRLRAGDWEGVFADAATAVRSRRTPEQFLGPLVQVMRGLGLPSDLQTRSVTEVVFGDGFPYSTRASCTVPDAEDPRVMILTEHPHQISLVQVGTIAEDRFYFSTLWHEEEGAWKLAAFFAKPATLSGQDWQAHAELAARERLEERNRNAALLYNIAIDLAVANAWTQSEEVALLQRRQRRITVSDLPLGQQPVTWGAAPDTFVVRSVGYGVLRNELSLLVTYDNPGDWADTTARSAESGRLASLLDEHFPEYGEVFSTVTLEARDPADPQRTWRRTYALVPAPE